MIPTGTPARRNHCAAPIGELTSAGQPSEPRRVRKFGNMPGGLSVPGSELGLALRDPGSLALPLADHHVEDIGYDRRGDSEENPRVGDAPAVHLTSPRSLN